MQAKLKISCSTFCPYMIHAPNMHCHDDFKVSLLPLGVRMGGAHPSGVNMYTELIISCSRFHSYNFMLQMCTVLKISRHAPPRPPTPKGLGGGRQLVAGAYPWGVNMYTKLKIS